MTSPSRRSLDRYDASPALAPGDDDVLAGLRAAPRRLPCRLLYDAQGARLFERICTLDSYYLTRTELALLQANLEGIAAQVGPAARVIEPGSGEGIKTRLLLHALAAPSGYVPIDVSGEQLARTARRLRGELAGLEVQPLIGDYTGPLELPVPRRAPRRTLVFFPGSTIGNFEPADACAFLARMAMLAGPEALLLLGADATADPDALLDAYDDPEGVTAAFNLNILAHLNRSHDATFDRDAFAHRAVWNPAHGRVEMHLVSRRRQVVRVGGETIGFADGEAIVTEHCYKHPPSRMRALLGAAGWRVLQVFTASAHPVRLWLCSSAGRRPGDVAMRGSRPPAGSKNKPS